MTPSSQSKEEMSALATRAELLAWADEAQALIDGGNVPASEVRKANACVAALRAFPQQPATGTASAVGDGVREALAKRIGLIDPVELKQHGGEWKNKCIIAVTESERDVIVAALSAPSPSSIELDGVRPSSAPGREAELLAFIKQLSDALLSARPLGGSELFVNRFGNYYADPEFCANAIKQMSADLHEARIAVVRAERAALISNGTGEAGDAPSELKLGDIVCMNETSPYFHDCRGVEMKIVSLRIDPRGNQWASTIDAPYDQHHRGNGYYDSEATDTDVRYLSLISRTQADE